MEDGRVDDGVNDGLRPPAKSDDADARPPVPVLAALSLAWLAAGESDFDEWANQLFVAAIACLTACRPLSSMPLPPDPALLSLWSSSVFPSAEPAPRVASLELVAAREPTPADFETLGF